MKLKLFFVTKFFVFLLLVCFKSYAEDLKSKKNIITIGSNNAIVKIKIFSSFTCPHCATFHNKVVPEIKKKYVDSGKVQLIFIDFPLDQAAFNASKILHCLGEKKRINFMDLIYENQSEWTGGSNIEDINKNLKKIVKNLGISSISFDKCLIDQDISDKILNGRIEASRKYTINSTPTVIINEEKLDGSANFKNIKKKIDKII
ncbi:MAG: Protein-disulfide isomerase [Pelagibacterales bacterium]|nr:Protein-disulfide isomerase [Pelagibacterales bacterium]